MRRLTHIVLLTCVLLLASCQKKIQPGSLSYGSEEYEQYDDKPETEVNTPLSTSTASSHESEGTSHGATNQNIPQQIIDIWSYSPQSVNVPAQTTIERAVYDTYPNMRKCYDYANVGGVKFIGEMSADRAGHNYSYYSTPITLNILSMSQLHLGFISSYYNIICQILNGNIRIESARIISGLSINIVVRNLSQTNQDVEFAQGQMVEVNENHVQNVVVSANSKVRLNPNESRTLTLPVFCVAHHRNSPAGSPARITPYVMRASSTTFQSQQSVWNIIESNDDPNSYVTFYVWGKGDITSSGRRSATGHAFVRIPTVGVYGFSTKNGELLNDEGHIYDHTANIRYATDSCRIKVSEESIKAMKKKLRCLQQNVPRYKIGRSDCTSFVMDIADAGGIHYGARITIQTPVGFMQELKKHNYYTY